MRAQFKCLKNMHNMAYGYWIIQRNPIGVFSIISETSNNIGTMNFDEKGSVGRVLNEKSAGIYAASSTCQKSHMRSEGRYISKTAEVKSKGIALITDGWLSRTCKSVINMVAPNHYLANPYYDLTLHEVAFHCIPPSVIQKVGSYFI